MRNRCPWVVVVALALAAAACSGTDTERPDRCNLPTALKAVGHLAVATSTDAPLPWIADGDPTSGRGYESALVYALADELGIDGIEWTTVPPEEVISANAQEFDFAIGQYSINVEDEELIDFSDAYYTIEQTVLGLPDNPIAEARELADLSGSRLGAVVGLGSLEYITEQIQPTAEPLPLESHEGATAAIEAGQIDAIIVDLPTAYHVVAEDFPEAAILGVLPLVEGAPQYGMVFETASPLAPCINDALAVLREDGILAELEDEWLKQGGEIPAFDR